MAVIVFDRLDLLVTDYIMGNSGSITPPSPWKVAMATRLVTNYVQASAWAGNDTGTNLNEIGGTTANGYARQSVNRDQTGAGWAAGVTDSPGKRTDGAQVTFTFTGAPSPNSANAWVVTDGTTLNAGQVYMAGDTAAARTYGNGDTQKVTPKLKASN
jgi:hypothetical protein